MRCSSVCVRSEAEKSGPYLKFLGALMFIYRLDETRRVPEDRERDDDVKK